MLYHRFCSRAVGAWVLEDLLQGGLARVFSGFMELIMRGMRCKNGTTNGPGRRNPFEMGLRRDKNVENSYFKGFQRHFIVEISI